jgi:hypothetical protein
MEAASPRHASTTSKNNRKKIDKPMSSQHNLITENGRMTCTVCKRYVSTNSQQRSITALQRSECKGPPADRDRGLERLAGLADRRPQAIQDMPRSDEGQPAPPQMPPPAINAEGNRGVEVSQHVLFASGELSWCRRCAAYSLTRARLIARQCNPANPGDGKARRPHLKRLLEGKHPRTGERLPNPVRVYDEHEKPDSQGRRLEPQPPQEMAEDEEDVFGFGFAGL